MEFLEDVVPAGRLQWLGANMSAVSAESRCAWYEHVSECFCRHPAKDILYAKEVLLCLAHAAPIPAVPPALFKIGGHMMVARALPALDAAFCERLEHTLRHGTDDICVFRMYGQYHIERYLRTCTHATQPTSAADANVVKRMAKVLSAFARETTFKVHGDACLHADIVTCVLPSFMSSTMAFLETPYQLAATAFPTQVNDMVRPLLNTSVRDRIGQVKFDGPYKMRDVILAAGLLVELVGQKPLVLVTNAHLCKGSPQPSLYVRRKPCGGDEVGIRSGRVFSAFPKTASVCDILVSWLQTCRDRTVCGTEAACEIMLDEATDCNPLFKYLS